jgi:hypothetical protein
MTVRRNRRPLRLAAAAFLFMAVIFGYNENSLADAAEVEEGQRIRLDKARIIGAVERPGTFYHIPWRSPELQEKNPFEFNRGFRNEIQEFIDREEMSRRHHGVDQ